MIAENIAEISALNYLKKINFLMFFRLFFYFYFYIQKTSQLLALSVFFLGSLIYKFIVTKIICLFDLNYQIHYLC